MSRDVNITADSSAPQQSQANPNDAFEADTPSPEQPSGGASTEFVKRGISFSHLGAHVLPGKGPVEQRIVSAQFHSRQTFNGPMPHPSILAGYGKIVPTAPERILAVFEQDSQHTRDFEMTALEGAKADNKRVHWMAYSLIVTGYAMAGLFAWMNKDVLAGIVLTTTIVGTVVGFLQGKKDKSESVEKSDE